VQDAASQLPLFEAEQEQPGQKPGFSVRQSHRAKRLSIKVFPRGRVEVVVPRRTSARMVKAFVEENKDWIARARDSFAANYAPEAFALPSAVTLPTMGEQFEIQYLPEPGAKNVRFRVSGGVVALSGNTNDEQACVRALQRWLSRVARRVYEPRLRALALMTETPFEKMHIRMQRTCWGSRSSSGTISLNLCLLFLHPELTRYLMIHELCHGRHMNHSKRFWKRVSRFEANYKVLDRRLGESWRDVPAWLGVY
jgi:predicted metal-dependent hydrolase